MKWSVYLGRIAGVQVYIHWTFALLIGWIFIQYFQVGGWQMGITGVLFILALFGCVTLHEFGHALVARHYKFPAKSITLLPIGGLAQFERLPEKPMQEFWMAIAGPLVNVVIAGGLYIYLLLASEMQTLAALNMGQGFHFGFNLFVANGILAVFNLIPAFPMDGGRILRALLSFRFNRARATRIAASIGQLLAIAFVFFGFFYNIWMIFIAIFIFVGAGGEALLEETKFILSGYKVKDALMTRFITLSPRDTIGRAVKLLLEGQEQDFLVTEDGTVVGVVGQKDIIKAVAGLGTNAPVAQAMRKDFLTLEPGMSLQEVYLNMLNKEHVLSPVYENGKLAGIIDRENINELLMLRQALDKHTKN